MDEDDDLYGGTGEDAQMHDQKPAVKAENEVDMDGNEEEEEEDSDDDVQFTLDKPEGAKSSTPAQQSKKEDEPSSDSKAAKSGTPIKAESHQPQRSSSTVPPQQPPSGAKATLTHAGKEGKDFPALSTSTLDVNATPLYPDQNGKPITALDIDADLAEHSKPWRLPGTDQTDFFNYGFDEFTWAQYAIRQQTMVGTIQEQRKQDEQMKAMFGGGPAGPGGSGMGGGGGMPGMPSEQEMMAMFQNGMAQGMTQEQFMEQMMGGGGGRGGPGMGGPRHGPGGFSGGPGGNFGGPQGGFGGPGGQNFGGGPRVPSGSPHPQGQGFQPPTGPSGGGQDGAGVGMGSMEGYSPQQMAIMQQQQGGGRGRGRGRGRW